MSWQCNEISNEYLKESTSDDFSHYIFGIKLKTWILFFMVDNLVIMINICVSVK